MPTLVNCSEENGLHLEKSQHCGSDVDQVKGEEKPSSMESLPEECLFEIFRRLSGQERSACACTSKPWLDLISSIRRADMCNTTNLNSSDASSGEELEEGGYLSRCLEGKNATDLRLLAISVGTAGLGGLGKLLIRGSNNLSCTITDFGLSRIARGCPFLKNLSIWNVANVSDEGLSEIAKGCRLIEKLDLSWCLSLADKGLIAIGENCPNLTSLRLDTCPDIGNEGLQVIARNCSSLELVSIKDCPLVGDQGVVSLLVSSNCLAKLMLDGVSISDFALDVMGHYGKSIDHLALTNLEKTTERGFKILGTGAGLCSLVFFSVTSCVGVTDQSIEAIAKGCPSLKQLSLSICHFLFDRGLLALLRSASSLLSLHLNEISKITLAGVIMALSVCKSNLRLLSLVSCVGLRDMVFGTAILGLTPCRSLRSLSVTNSPGLGNTGLIVLNYICPELTQLDISGLTRVTDDGFLRFLGLCKGALVKLNLTGCSNLSDIVIDALVRAHGNTLKTLNLEGCRKLTDVTLLAIARHCWMLSELHITFCEITDFGLVMLSAAGQLNIEILSIAGCRQISNISATSLINMRESLIGLNIRGCTSMTEETVSRLEEKLWNCDILH